MVIDLSEIIEELYFEGFGREFLMNSYKKEDACKWNYKRKQIGMKEGGKDTGRL